MTYILNSKPIVVSESYQMEPSNKVIIADCSGSNLDLVLPKADQIDFAVIHAVSNNYNNNVKVKPPLRSSINGVEEFISLIRNQSIFLISDGISKFYTFNEQKTQLLTQSFFGNATIQIPIPVNMLITSKDETEGAGNLSYAYGNGTTWNEFPSEFPFVVPAGSMIQIISTHITEIKTTTLTYQTV